MAFDGRDHRERTSGLWTSLKDSIRRMVIEGAVGLLWEVSGAPGEYDDGIPAFQGIGFASRPTISETSAAECIVLKVGGASGRPVIVATHDEDLRRVHDAVKDMEPDEVAIFNSGGYVKLDKNGDAHIVVGAGRKLYVKREGGSTDQLVTKADFLNHTHATAPTGPTTPPTAIAGSFGYTAALESE